MTRHDTLTLKLILDQNRQVRDGERIRLCLIQHVTDRLGPYVISEEKKTRNPKIPEGNF